MSARVGPSAKPGDPTAPYLPVVGSVSLRFQSPPLPPDTVARPAAGGPPLLAAPETAPTPDVIPAVKLVPAKPDANPPEHAAQATTPKSTPPPILPDDTRPRVQPEDFLPFFQFPAGQSGDVQVIAPVRTTPLPPDRAPPSSATYRQQ